MSESPEAVDRGLMIACAVIWLLVLGMVVAATVALIDLGRGHPSGENGSGAPWLLYSIIAISAVVIAAAIPLLLRARRVVAEVPSVPVPATVAHPDPAGQPVRHTASVLPAATVDRIWLRCGLGVLAATGVAMLAVALAAYLLAVDVDGGAWGALGVGALITVAMAALPVYCLRQLRAALGAV